MDSFLFLLLGIVVLLPIYAFTRRGTFFALIGAGIVLLAPFVADLISNGPSGREMWLTTFRLLGAGAFMWGVAENIIEAIRPTPVKTKDAL